MVKKRNFQTEDLIRECMFHFWNRGYRSTSIDDLVNLVGCSRHGIYNQIGNKDKLFSRVLDCYSREVVSPAFSLVEQPDSNFSDIGRFFNVQFDLAESNHDLVKGCLITNSITELSALQEESKEKIFYHNQRLHEGYRNLLVREGVSSRWVNEKANSLAVFTNGVWLSSNCQSTTILRNTVDQFLKSFYKGLSNE